MAVSFSVLGWEILWTEEPGIPQYMELQKSLDMTQGLNNNKRDHIHQGDGTKKGSAQGLGAS